MKKEIVYLGIADVKPYPNNPRKNEGAINAVANSIKEFGFQQPIIVDGDNVIVCGHTRYEAAKTLGLETVPVIVADELTEEQVKAFRIADNKTSEKAVWDYDKLVEEMLSIDLDMTEFGFADFEIKSLLDDSRPEQYDDELIKKYSVDDEALLKCKKVIITYEGEEQEEFLKQLFKVDELRIDTRCGDIMARYE